MKLQLPNFTLTRGELPPEVTAVPQDRLARFARRVKSMGVWFAVGTCFFVFFTWLSLPTEAIAWRISHEAKKAGYVIDVGDISLRPWGTVLLEDVMWTFQPSRPSTPPGFYEFEEIVVDFGIFSYLTGDLNVEVEYEREEARVWAAFRQDDDASQFELLVEDLPLYAIPKAPQALGVPLVGIFAMKADLTLPKGEFAKAEGEVEVSCSGCRAGDGDSKLFVPGSSALTNGMTIPEIDLGTLTGKLIVTDGVAEVDGAIETSSDDLTVSLTGKLKLGDPFSRSRFDMTLKVSLTEALQERSEALRISYQTASPKVRLEPPENGLGFNLAGPVTKPRFIGINVRSKLDKRAERRQRQLERDARRKKSRADREAKADRKKRSSAGGADGDAESRANDGLPEPADPSDTRQADPREPDSRAAEPPSGQGQAGSAAEPQPLNLQPIDLPEPESNDELPEANEPANDANEPPPQTYDPAPDGESPEQDNNGSQANPGGGSDGGGGQG